MRLIVGIKDSYDTPLPSVSLQPGETLDLPVTWANPDGSVRSMTGATVELRIYAAVSGARVLKQTLSDPSLIWVSSATTIAWEPRRTYRCELWESRSGLHGLDVSSGAFTIVLGDA